MVCFLVTCYDSIQFLIRNIYYTIKIAIPVQSAPAYSSNLTDLGNR